MGFQSFLNDGSLLDQDTLVENPLSIVPGLFSTFGPYQPFTLSMVNQGAPAAAAWPFAARTFYIEWLVERAITVKRLGWVNGGTLGSSVDVAVMDGSGNRLVSAYDIGSALVAQSGTNAIQWADVADTVLSPGRYYIAMYANNTTGFFWSRALGPVTARSLGMVVETPGGGRIPASWTIGNPADSYTPVILAEFSPSTGAFDAQMPARINSWSADSGLVSRGVLAPAPPTSTAIPATNRIVFVPFRARLPYTVQRYMWANGSAASPGNVRMWLCDMSGAWYGTESGSVAASGTSVPQFAVPTGGAFTIPAGTYYFAVLWDAASGITANRMLGMSTITALEGAMLGLKQQDPGSFAFPASATFADWSSTGLPLIGLADSLIGS